MSDPRATVRWIGWLLLVTLALLLGRQANRDSAPPVAAEPLSQPDAGIQPATSSGDQALPAYDVSRPPLGQIPPGTVIGEQAPSGWTHLIVKSQPRIRDQDLSLLDPRNIELASLFFTALLARVEPVGDADPIRYRQDDAAVGYGTPVDGQDTILTPPSSYKLKAPIGLAGRIVLRACITEMSTCCWAARSDTFGLIDTPATMLRDGKHRTVVLRYALLVDAQRGTLDVVLWRIDRNPAGEYLAPPGEAHWLPPDRHVDCTLAFDAEQSLLGIPARSAFAIEAIPQGRVQFALPESMAPIAARQQLTAQAAAELESELRRLLAEQASPPSPAADD